MQTLCYNAYDESVELAKEKGPFPLFQWDGPEGGVARSKFIQSLPEELQEKIRAHGLRNSTVITVPPVGTGSIIAQCSSGIEPIFCTSYRRRVKQADGESFAEYKVFHPLIKELLLESGRDPERLAREGRGDEELPDYVVTAHEIDPYFRVRMQGVIQKYVDSSISSTVNLAEDVSLETVADIYITAYKAGLKGITVYREGSREGILQTDKQAEKKEAAAARASVASQAPDLAPSNAPAAEPEGAVGGTDLYAAGIGTGLLPRYRPAVTRGMTERIRTGEGNLYVTINEDEKGLCEVFTSIGKAGGNAAAQSEAISRLISLCLRSGVDTLEIVKQLKGICGPNPVWDNGTLILSGPDAIGKALERYVQRKASGQEELDLVSEPGAGGPNVTGGSAPAGRPNGNGAATAYASPASEVGATRLLATCPDCGGSVSHREGCIVCSSCGWSRC